MRKALVIGIDDYAHGCTLNACVKDATKFATVIEKNGDGSPNFGVNLQTCPPEKITRVALRPLIEELFSGTPDIALFYFSGHGSVTSTGECIVTYDARQFDEGISMSEVLKLSNKSKARNKIIIFDCCHAGGMGDFNETNTTYISDGTTILAACQKEQYAVELFGGGVFTSLLIEGLQGGAADLLGAVSPGSLYAYIDRSLGPWEQRPVFKTNVSQFTPLRKVAPPIDQALLRAIPNYFPNPSDSFALSPEFEFTDKRANPAKVDQFKILQKYERVGLITPVGEEHMYFAAVNSKSCKLTAMGVHYWRLAKEGII